MNCDYEKMIEIHLWDYVKIARWQDIVDTFGAWYVVLFYREIKIPFCRIVSALCE